MEEVIINQIKDVAIRVKENVEQVLVGCIANSGFQL